ncbi:MAG TPA: glutathione S-transferase family protein, partial [Acinetobacter sp.]|nr:glutathione S-transferase family protein [Acinetobacter sp.]
MALKLYTNSFSRGVVVDWLLIELGIEHELKMLDFDKHEQKSPEYLAINPQGRVPTLLIDGQVLTESAAIAMHLADLHPQAALAPAIGTPERAAYYRWMFFCAYTLMPAYRGWFYPDEPAGGENIDKVKSSSRAAIEYAWQQVNNHL